MTLDLAERVPNHTVHEREGFVIMRALTLVRILRPIALWPRAQAHLTDCAAYEIIDRRLSPWLLPLGIRHVLGFAHIPWDNTANVLSHPAFQPIKSTIPADDLTTEADDPPILELS
jgi:hypothetical protein